MSTCSGKGLSGSKTTPCVANWKPAADGWFGMFHVSSPVPLVSNDGSDIVFEPAQAERAQHQTDHYKYDRARSRQFLHSPGNNAVEESKDGDYG